MIMSDFLFLNACLVAKLQFCYFLPNLPLPKERITKIQIL